MNRRTFLASTTVSMASALSRSLIEPAGAAPSASSARVIDVAVDLGQPALPLPHYWAYAGSDRTAIGLRAQWREDLASAARATGIRQVRCHGLFDDEMGIAAQGGRNFNFLYLDQVYDFMLEHGVRPFVELGFMPDAYARGQGNRIFNYQGNASPPRDWKDWYDLVQAFTRHCIERYGRREVLGWKFEVWNEPNLTFWAGTQAEYFELYRQSVLALKDIDADLQVGGPASAQLQWIPQLIAYCEARGLPLDFISSHVYPSDPQLVLFGTQQAAYPFEQVMPRALAHARAQIAASARPHTPLWITEWSSQNPAFIADTVKNCFGLAQAMSYWTFSNVFEEGGVPHSLFNQTYGMTEQWGIKRPSFHTFSLLHRLGDSVVPTGQAPVWVTRRADGSHALLLWNLMPVTRQGEVANGNPTGAGGGYVSDQGAPLTVRLALRNLAAGARATLSQVDSQIGSALPAWAAMGRPAYPTRAQLQQLRDASQLPTPTSLAVTNTGAGARVSINVAPNGVALLELG